MPDEMITIYVTIENSRQSYLKWIFGKKKLEKRFKNVYLTCEQCHTGAMWIMNNSSIINMLTY